MVELLGTTEHNHTQSDNPLTLHFTIDLIKNHLNWTSLSKIGMELEDFDLRPLRYNANLITIMLAYTKI